MKPIKNNVISFEIYEAYKEIIFNSYIKTCIRLLIQNKKVCLIDYKVVYKEILDRKKELNKVVNIYTKDEINKGLDFWNLKTKRVQVGKPRVYSEMLRRLKRGCIKDWRAIVSAINIELGSKRGANRIIKNN